MKKLVGLILSIGSLVAWFYAIMEHISSESWIRLALDVFIPPVGVIDGIGLYMGWW